MKKRRPSKKELMDKAKELNEQCPIGTDVLYWSYVHTDIDGTEIREKTRQTKTRSNIFIASGEIVTFVEGISSYVSMDNIEIVDEKR